MRFPLTFDLLSHWLLVLVVVVSPLLAQVAIFIHFPLGLSQSLLNYSSWLICYRLSFLGSVPSIDNLLHVEQPEICARYERNPHTTELKIERNCETPDGV
ncbi:hypothetical protein ASPBRDRAFT_40893 [Aspergillus brasiliensis CBS 101740]|uniref:Uncharacterized protein n=1 Tax=Aspergillus brasiliensis (strain CBS 101740 / IMI 381727 / IBT 21946) TaxID=767769 RepID=A0A1L9UNF3_ASPBC|nr:hypothetical protein ASPBRDRAFT_40893 [Aspergillus brasiliensis CBS 101740]